VIASDVLAAIVRQRGSAPLITGPGAISGGLYSRAHQPATIYNMDLAYALPVAMGIALGAPGERVIAVEGDGSVVAGLPALATLGRYRPRNLVLVVVDNGRFGSTGEGWVSTATAGGTDLAVVARGCGVEPDHVLEPPDAAGLERDLERALATDGPWVLVCRVDLDPASVSRSRPRTGIDWGDAATVFRLEMARRMHGQ
jgi:thiamine pyrophosphate-dependent acetolactate synthase large subunit-like protein